MIATLAVTLSLNVNLSMNCHIYPCVLHAHIYDIYLCTTCPQDREEQTLPNKHTPTSTVRGSSPSLAITICSSYVMYRAMRSVHAGGQVRESSQENGRLGGIHRGLTVRWNIGG